MYVCKKFSMSQILYKFVQRLSYHIKNIDKIIRRYSSKLNYMNISHHIKLSISK